MKNHVVIDETILLPSLNFESKVNAKVNELYSNIMTVSSRFELLNKKRVDLQLIADEYLRVSVLSPDETRQFLIVGIESEMRSLVSEMGRVKTEFLDYLASIDN